MAPNTSFHVISFTETDAEIRAVQKRKFHNKVRSGCLACRLKRVKCDERRPVCLRCDRNKRQCSYDGHALDKDEAAAARSRPLSAREGGISGMSSVTVLPFSPPNKEVGTSTVHLTHHLWSQWDDIFPFAESAEIVSLFEVDPLIRNILFAVTASHLRHVSPGNRQHRIAEHYQQSIALHGYQKKLFTHPHQLGQQGTNELLTGASLLNMLSFALPEPDATVPGSGGGSGGELDPESSWIFSPREDRMGWLALQAGLRPLMLATSEYLQPSLSFLGQVFLGEPTTAWTFSRLVKSLEGVPPHWVDFFELYDPMAASGCECAGADDVYRAPATILATVRHLEPTGYHVFRSLQFLGKLQGQFRDLIYYRDERALWLFGYWLGVMCRFRGLWWCERRVLRDYRAICLWLQKLRLAHRPGRRGELWATMMEELQSVSTSHQSPTGNSGLIWAA